MPTIHLCPFAAVDPALRERYRARLDASERARHDGLRRDAARLQFLVGRTLLRETLAQRLGCDAAVLRFGRDEQGKPFLAQPRGARWRFNLSHSRDWAALALGEEGEIGVDVEFRGRRNDLDGIAGRFFQPAEAAALRALPEAERRRRFFELWTIKEAAVKALGRGIAGALAGTEVRCGADGRIDLTLRDGAAWEGGAAVWHFDLGALGSDYSLAAVLLTAPGRVPPVEPPRLFTTVPLVESRPVMLAPTLAASPTG
jgi:4'-phosphopantetheinyl transferase